MTSWYHDHIAPGNDAGSKIWGVRNAHCQQMCINYSVSRHHIAPHTAVMCGDFVGDLVNTLRDIFLFL